MGTKPRDSFCLQVFPRLATGKTEEVDDEPLMLRYFRGDEKVVDDDDDEDF